ncbi:peptidoglycan D,D-transpeptidase FtsI family protein [Bacillus horti]|uniref:peptidoglycan D,D-transpeptidase FtsI family protein n=1 Tax=Caldalkalibacillus horti TaxID=77523 RepID=UPI0027D7C03C|nr:penicillin-binding protein 2 [Bacillus horti]
MLGLMKRQIVLLLIFSVILLGLIGRLAYIQLIGTESFSKHQINLIKKSVQQRQQQFTLHSGRGNITDRNGVSFTGVSTHVLVLFPILQHTLNHEDELNEVAQILKINPSLLAKQIELAKEPYILKDPVRIFRLSEDQANQVNKLAIPGLLGLPFEMRYAPDQMLAQHLVGYLGQNTELIKKDHADALAQGLLQENSEIGISGIEKSFQPFLQGIGPVSLSYSVDARGYPLSGLGIRYMNQDHTFYPLTIQSTLDMELQEYVEQVWNKRNIREGAIVVLDNRTSEVLAMASKPLFTPQMGNPGAWENKTIKRYAPGSVFKIVIAAAAMEEGLVSAKSKFECDGELRDSGFHCWKKEGHGHLTFEEGFAHSCNIVFAQLAEQLGAEKIEEYASKLGLLEPTVWHTSSLFHFNNFRQLEGEEQGQIYANHRQEEERQDKQYLWRTGIGQLDVQVSPIAVANMLATISKAGHKGQVRVVSDMLYQTGAAFYHFGKQSMNQPSIKPYTAYQLQKLMAKVVEDGTAQSLKERPWSSAGKTGTAQIKQWNDRGVELEKNNHWFAGYYPQNNPRYSVVVVHLNQEVNSPNLAIDVFSDIIDWLDNRS